MRNSPAVMSCAFPWFFLGAFFHQNILGRRRGRGKPSPGMSRAFPWFFLARFPLVLPRHLLPSKYPREEERPWETLPRYVPRLPLVLPQRLLPSKYPQEEEGPWETLPRYVVAPHQPTAPSRDISHHILGSLPCVLDNLLQ